MTLPARLIQAVRPQASAGVLAGAAVVALTFAATPFLLPDISDRFHVPIGLTGLLSTAQVGSFAVASFLAGRLFRPRMRFHYGALMLVALSAIASAFAPSFPLLLATRIVGGLGMGTLTWIAWADATRFHRGIGDVAAVAPVTAAVASPLLGWLVGVGGLPLVYAAVAVASLAALAFRVDFGDLPRIGKSVSESRSNRFLLMGMMLLTVGGSAVFIFSGATAAEQYGMTPFGVSLAYSLNAVTGVIATRFNARRHTAGLWLAGCVVSALLLGYLDADPIFFILLAVWGFAFWMAIPAVFRLLAERSNTPSERVGDAQAIMALGRVAGPIVGGLALGGGQYGLLSIVGASFMALAAIAIGGVEFARSRP